MPLRARVSCALCIFLGALGMLTNSPSRIVHDKDEVVSAYTANAKVCLLFYAAVNTV